MNNRVGKGFTIVELLIVIVVIAILAAITIVAYNGIQKRATTSTIQSALNGAAKQIELVKVETTAYPTSFPSSVQAPKNIMLSLAQNGASYCINAESITGATDQRWFYEPGRGIQQGTCSGGIIQSSEIGANPNAVKDTGFTGLGTGTDQWQYVLGSGGSYGATTRDGDAADPYPNRKVLTVVNAAPRSGITFAYLRGPVDLPAIISGTSYTLTYYVRLASGAHAGYIAYFGVMNGAANNASFQYVGNATIPNGSWQKITRTVPATQNGVSGTFLYLGLNYPDFNSSAFTLEFQGFEIRAN
jgi:prepilin-type N-terminal cleavage/methylation domain-containing protein